MLVFYTIGIIRVFGVRTGKQMMNIFVRTYTSVSSQYIPWTKRDSGAGSNPVFKSLSGDKISLGFCNFCYFPEVNFMKVYKKGPR
jgi:hypothetical protein